MVPGGGLRALPSIGHVRNSRLKAGDRYLRHSTVKLYGIGDNILVMYFISFLVDHALNLVESASGILKEDLEKLGIDDINNVPSGFNKSISLVSPAYSQH